MKIGEDFDKIEFSIWGLDLSEPNAFIGDVILSVFALYFGFRIWKIAHQHSFFKYWFRFFMVFCLSFLIGGLGHLLWNYWGVEGKYFSWYAGLWSTYYLEMAMISLLELNKWQTLFKRLSAVKLLIMLLALTLVLVMKNVTVDVSKGLFVPALNLTIGTLFSLGILPIYFKKIRKNHFSLFKFSVIILVPIACFQQFKINIAPWFDRNDMSHILLLLTIVLYYIEVIKYDRRVHAGIKNRVLKV